jgi:predicted transcriptional regulator
MESEMPRKKDDKPLTYEEKEKIKIMIADGCSFNAVGKELKRDPKTVKRYASEPQVSSEIKQKQQNLAEWYEDLAKRMLSSITDQDIEKINAYQRTVSAGIATDKLRLLTDQSTQNIALIVEAVADLKRRRKEQG